MEKQIPYLFESIVVSSPFTQISSSEPNTGRLKVGVFTKYANRNFSYITDAFADHLIESAVRQHCPVVGFYDRETNTWASHTGPSLASAYGYVEDFVGWEPFTDSDGTTRDYAVFQIVLHINYFEEANNIAGQNQSMELDPKTIEGDWTDIEGVEYFTYTKGEMLGFCIIGEHEPCFSSSFFFNKNGEYNTRFEQFSSLLVELRNKVEEAENFEEGGEQKMDEQNNEVVEISESTPVVAESAPEVEEESAPLDLSADFEKLQGEYEALQHSFESLEEESNKNLGLIADYEKQIGELKDSITSLTSELETANGRIANYEKAEREAIEARKDELITSYEKLMSEEEIAPIKEKVQSLSYDELESKLAVTFSRKQIKTESENKVPFVNYEESGFAALIQKYKKN